VTLRTKGIYTADRDIERVEEQSRGACSNWPIINSGTEGGQSFRVNAERA